MDDIKKPVARVTTIWVGAQHYLDLRNERDRLKSQLDDCSGKYHQLTELCKSTEKRERDALSRAEKAESRAAALYDTLLRTVRAFGGVAQDGVSDTFLALGVPAEAGAVVKRLKETEAHVGELRAAIKSIDDHLCVVNASAFPQALLSAFDVINTALAATTVGSLNRIKASAIREAVVSLGTKETYTANEVVKIMRDKADELDRGE